MTLCATAAVIDDCLTPFRSDPHKTTTNWRHNLGALTAARAGKLRLAESSSGAKPLNFHAAIVGSVLRPKGCARQDDPSSNKAMPLQTENDARGQALMVLRCQVGPCGRALCKSVGSAVVKLCAQERMLAGAEDAQMSSRYRWLVRRPVSHALPSAAEAPVCLQKRPTGESALRGQGELLDRHEPRSLIDSLLEQLRRFQVR